MDYPGSVPLESNFSCDSETILSPEIDEPAMVNPPVTLCDIPVELGCTNGDSKVVLTGSINLSDLNNLCLIYFTIKRDCIQL